MIRPLTRVAWLVLLYSSACSEGHRDPRPSFDAGSLASDDPNVLARAAVVIGSCIPDDGINRNLGHMWDDGEQYWFHFKTVAGCIAASGGGCAALERCMGWTAALAPQGCTELSCDGDVVRGCGDGLRVTLDCARLGLHCDERTLCSAAPSVACDTATYKMHCADDGVPLYCGWRKALYHGADCPALGLSCSGVDCVGNGEVCQANEQLSNGRGWNGVSCTDSATLHACVGGRTTERACADEGPGFTCQNFEDAYFCGIASECLPAGASSMSPRGIRETCDGDTIVFCNAGRIERISCKDLGFDGCRDRLCVPSIFNTPSPD